MEKEERNRAKNLQNIILEKKNPKEFENDEYE